MELNNLKGIGPARLKSFRAVGINSLRDLLYFFPVRYEDHIHTSLISEISDGPVMLEGFVQEKPKVFYFHGMNRVTASLQDSSGKIPIIWFNEPWMIHQLPIQKKILLYGQVQNKRGRLELLNPKLIAKREWAPIYKKIAGIPGKTLQEMILDILKEADDLCPETLPQPLLQRSNLLPLPQAIRYIHIPESPDNLQAARRRLDFEKMLVYLTAVKLFKSHAENGWRIDSSGINFDCFWNRMEITPTEAQSRVLREIAQDMNRNQPMARMIQGDVGCGKTAIAFGAIYLAAENGFQSAMMAPTEILARQHYQNALEHLSPLGISCALLTGHTKASERKEILHQLRNGECNAVFGTHALISQDVRYARLGLVITDEQHRFGVRQRTALQQKGCTDFSPSKSRSEKKAEKAEDDPPDQGKKAPHVLVMSATPIPRSLALILYGDLDLSLVDELPPGRKEVRTYIVPEVKREGMYTFLRELCAKGQQGYVVCPLAMESEALPDIRNAQTLYDELNSGLLKELRIGKTWGTQRSEDKQETIKAFSEGRIDVLVATTVIEVGVNVPNATVMIVENAERYGLSQLHQLRGRVGRGEKESWCFLCTEKPGKIKILCSTTDGFEIARQDLENRGPGDLIGTRQSGEASINMVNIGDISLLNEVVQYIHDLENRPELSVEKEQIGKLTMRFFQENALQISIN